MHVLIIPSWYPQHTNDFNGSFFREQAQAIAEAGSVVGVVAVNGIPIYATDRLRHRRRTIDISDDRGVRTIRGDVILPLPKAHGINYAVHYRALKRAFGLYVGRNGMPDVLHAHSMFPAGVLTHRLAAEFGIPFVVTEHRPSSIDRLANRWFRRHGVAAARAADRRIAVANGFVPKLNKAYEVPDASWEYIPGLLSPQLESAPVRAAPRQPPFVFGHVSHLDPGKRVDLLIDAFADSFAGDTSVALRIAGDSAERASLQAQVRAHGIDAQVKFVGAVPRESIASEFASSHVFVLPSHMEAFGTVLWEAMATGLPVVSSRTWAGTNAVTPEVGVLFDVDDRDQLASALTAVRESFGQYDPQSIRSRCIAHCGREAFCSMYVAAYEQAQANGFPRPHEARTGVDG